MTFSNLTAIPTTFQPTTATTTITTTTAATTYTTSTSSSTTTTAAATTATATTTTTTTSVNCQWGQWTEWASCSVTCGGGTQSSTRFIEQEALNGGARCVGDSIRDRPCNTNGCPVDCVWGQWTGWGSCSVTCGGGTQTSMRTIKKEAENGGNNCVGKSIRDQPCNTNGCPMDCQWGQWTAWESCTKTCGGGTQTAKREVRKEAKDGGNCPGSSTRNQPCNTNGCPVDCLWGPWLG